MPLIFLKLSGSDFKLQSLFNVIIVNYNSTRHSFKNIAALLKSSLHDNINIWVQDNASWDGAIRLKHRFPAIHLTLNPQNLGFGAAINQVIGQGRAPYVMLINPDACIEDGFFESVLEYMDKHRDIGILGPKVLDDDGSVQGSARAFPNPLTALFGRNSFLTRIFPNNALSRANVLNLNGANDRPMAVDWVSGACMVIRRDALPQTGNMDERFFMYWEDADLCKRMWLKGWKVVYYPKAVVSHQVGQSSRTKPYFTIYHFHKSCFRLYAKYAKWYDIPLIPIVIVALMIRAGAVVALTTLRRLKPAKTSRLSNSA